MRVSIEHSTQTTGLFSKTTHHVVSLRVEFSEEEQAIIRAHKLERDVVLERGPHSLAHKGSHDLDIFDLTIAGLLRREPDRYSFLTPLEAKNYEAELQEVLPQLKTYIMENSGVEQKSTSFEL